MTGAGPRAPAPARPAPARSAPDRSAAARSDPPGTVRLEGVSKVFATDAGRKIVADRIDAVFPAGQAVALMGRNGAGKSSLLKVIAGSSKPSGGRVVTAGRVSWPVGLAQAFHGDLTGLQNLRFVARIYGRASDELEAFVQGFAGLGADLSEPVRTYSNGMRARLGFALSMGIPFDTYLIDEVASVGDLSFRRTCEATIRDRLSRGGAIVVSHNAEFLARVCDRAAVLEQGRLSWFDSVGDAMAEYREMMGV